MLPSVGRTYHDPLHGAISLSQGDPTEALLIQLIDTPACQRLRRIRQLGGQRHVSRGRVFPVYPFPRRNGDRPSSLRSPAQTHPQIRPYRSVVLCAALLHDLGHRPFSHTCEEIFGSQHEHWTLRILHESEPIFRLIHGFDPALLDQIQQVYQKQHPIPLVWQLVSSQLDCDRLDYLMRDSYFTGASYGRLDLDRILMALRYDPDSQQLVVAEKGMAAIEHYLIVRYFMYAQVYNHPKNLAATWVLERAFHRAKELLAMGKLNADEIVTAWLQQDCNQLPLQQYLDADDGVFIYHLQRWQHHADPILADLCRRFIDRDLLKALDVSQLSDNHQQQLLENVQQRLKPLGLEPLYYTGLRTTLSRGYTLYQQGIKLLTSTGLQEISQRSPLVQTLIQPWQRSWLLYPREIDPERLIGWAKTR